eukprot:CAMPEP_0185587438 /NCGR_PEP_ID=MMETSP0434-20130131/49151_1 /TAXON_ID=626734 ORGANISM="Favella taraikaensis, Strain Fe Narragansett Bay" /NCGR_SAMPLE_ID=MMETSP0434 /ASSEMBLY_ACC=CAM_ASM_000379 /LENGTH=123 /DNA_ID=CAMNT_0028209323 /DNA_START=44 /DNA_END=415 /DNA_ORIENTATION=+
MTRLRMKELKDQDKAGLEKKLVEYKKELSQLRVNQQVSGTASKLGKIGTMRKNIARILTVLNQTERANLRKFYAGKKFTPKSLRPKLTHTRRLALKPKEKARKTRAQLRIGAKFPLRKFAVKL